MISTGYPGTSSVLRTPARLAYRLLCVWVSVSCAGCLVLAAGAGGVAGAVYVMGKLKEEVNYPVPVVHDAAVAAMKDLGLKLEEDRADKLSAKMKSEFSDGTNIWIDLESIADSRTEITIRVGVTGDESRSRKILDTIKQHFPRASPP